MLIVVTHNQWGISTARSDPAGEMRIADRGKAFGMRDQDHRRQRPGGRATSRSQQAMAYVRKERKPFLLEANVSRLYGHSASGANSSPTRADCITRSRGGSRSMACSPATRWTRSARGGTERSPPRRKQVRDEPQPDGSSIDRERLRGGAGDSMANMAQAIRMALHYAEEHLGVTDVFGEDVGPPLGGVFTATQGLKTAWNSPLDERGIIGAAMGLGAGRAAAGRRDPVLRLHLQHHRSAQARRQHLLVERTATGTCRWW